MRQNSNTHIKKSPATQLCGSGQPTLFLVWEIVRWPGEELRQWQCESRERIWILIRNAPQGDIARHHRRCSCEPFIEDMYVSGRFRAGCRRVLYEAFTVRKQGDTFENKFSFSSCWEIRANSSDGTVYGHLAHFRCLFLFVTGTWSTPGGTLNRIDVSGMVLFYVSFFSAIVSPVSIYYTLLEMKLASSQSKAFFYPMK